MTYRIDFDKYIMGIIAIFIKICTLFEYSIAADKFKIFNLASLTKISYFIEGGFNL